jgi:hypothetical protein
MIPCISVHLNRVSGSTHARQPWAAATGFIMSARAIRSAYRHVFVEKRLHRVIFGTPDACQIDLV